MFCSGKFHGVITPITPSGWYSTCARLCMQQARSCGPRGCRWPRPARSCQRSFSASGQISPSIALCRVLPASRQISSHSESACSSSSSSIRARHPASLGERGLSRHAAWAARARAIRSWTSSGVRAGTSPSRSPVAGIGAGDGRADLLLELCGRRRTWPGRTLARTGPQVWWPGSRGPRSGPIRACGVSGVGFGTGGFRGDCVGLRVRAKLGRCTHVASSSRLGPAC